MANSPLRDEFPLAALPNAAYWARRHTEEVLRHWRLGADAAFVAHLVVSELVSNAAIATSTLSAAERDRYHHHPMSLPYPRLAALGQVLLRLSSDGSSHLLVEVGDQSDEPPRLQTPSLDSTHGRGLVLIENICDGWGWYPTTGTTDPSAQGDKLRKVVWARLGLASLR